MHSVDHPPRGMHYEGFDCNKIIICDNPEQITKRLAPATTEISCVKDLFLFKVAISDFSQVNSQFD